MRAGLLKIDLLGGVHIALKGSVIGSFVSRKATALFIYVVCQKRPVSRDTVAGLLWPENSQSRALANLSVALNSVRKQLADYIVADRNSIWLDTALPYQLDYDLFAPGNRSTPDIDLYDRQFAAYNGDFLAGFYLRATPEFEAWQLLEQERIRQIALRNFGQLAEHHLRTSSFMLGITVAQKLLALDPLYESGHRLLMQLFASNGMRSRALAQYDRCIALLDEELGVAPDTETTELGDAIRADRFISAAEAKAGEQPVGSLPASASDKFFGREKEAAILYTFLANPTDRLLTVTGPGGVGKTRLLNEISRQTQGEFADGSWFVPLEDATDLQSMCLTLAAVLRIPFTGGAAPADTIAEHLRTKSLLLILDNLEQLVAPETSQFIAQLVDHCPRLKIVATSRQQLGLHREQILSIHGLPHRHRQGLGHSPAIKLFVNRARKRSPTFSLTEVNGESVAAICALVQGMPLAIELAASWVPLLDPAGILTEMTRNFDFLRSEASDLPDRHRSLRAVFTSSWRLLDSSEQRTYSQLAIFMGAFSYHGANAVTAISHGQLRSLIDKSLVQLSADFLFQLHPFAKQYALERLAAAPGLEAATVSRYNQFFVNRLTEALPALNGPDSKTASADLIADLANFRQMWRLALRAEQYMLLEEALPGIARLFRLRGFVSEAAAMFADALNEIPESQTSLRAVLATDLANLYVLLSRLQEGKTVGELAISLVDKDNSLLLARAHQNTGDNCWRLGLYEAAKYHFDTAWRHLQNDGNLTRLSANVRYLHAVTVAYGDNDFALAETFLLEALAIWQSLADLQGQSMAYNVLGIFAYEKRAMGAALQYQQENLRICQQLADRVNEVDAHLNIGNIYNRTIQPELALQQYRAAHEIPQVTPPQLAIMYLGSAIAQAMLGHFAKAEQSRLTALQMFSEQDNRSGISYTHIAKANAELSREQFNLARLAYEQGQRDNEIHRDLIALQVRCWHGWALLNLGEVEAAEADFNAALKDQSQEIVAAARLGLAQLAAGRGEDQTAAEILMDIRPLLLEEMAVDHYEMLLWRLYQLSEQLGSTESGDLLEYAHSWVQHKAASFADPSNQHAYLTNIAPCRRIVAAYVDANR